MDKQLLDVVVYSEPGEHRFDPADWPGVTDLRVTQQGADSGGGDNGYVIVELYGEPQTA